MSAPLERPAIVEAARNWIGTPYHHQASLCGVGCDCLGLVRGVWRDLRGPEPEVPPPYTPEGSEGLGAEMLAAAALRHLVPVAPGLERPGDVLLFRWRAHLPAKHCAVLSAPDRIILRDQTKLSQDGTIPVMPAGESTLARTDLGSTYQKFFSLRQN